VPSANYPTFFPFQRVLGQNELTLVSRFLSTTGWPSHVLFVSARLSLPLSSSQKSGLAHHDVIDVNVCEHGLHHSKTVFHIDGRAQYYRRFVLQAVVYADKSHWLCIL
jgi:hypothetical protein